MCPYQSKKWGVFVCVFAVSFFSFCVVVSAQEIQEEKKTQALRVGVSPTLGMLTEQRGYLESLKGKVAIQEQHNKLDELLAPQPIALPTQELLNALQVPGEEAKGGDSDKTSVSSESQLLSVHGVDEGNLSANIRMSGKSISLKQGQMYNGTRVKITRERVSFGKTILSLE